MLGAGLAFGSAPAAAQSADIATSNAGTLYHVQASAIASVLGAGAGAKLRVQEFSSPTVYLPVVEGGQIDFALASLPELMRALEGGEVARARKLEKLRVVAVAAPLLSAFLVKASAPIRSFSDFKGKRVAWGYTQQPAAMNLMEAQFAAAGLKAADVITIRTSDAAQAADDFAAGKTDIFFAVGLDEAVQVEARVGPLRVIGLPDGGAVAASLAKAVPSAYVSEAKLPFGPADKQGPLRVMAYDTALISHAAADDDLVYRLTGALFESGEAIAKSSPTLRGFAAGRMVKTVAPAEYHPGAVKLFREKGLWPAK